MKFLDIEMCKELEIWPSVPEIVEIPKLKVMSELIIGQFSIASKKVCACDS